MRSRLSWLLSSLSLCILVMFSSLNANAQSPFNGFPDAFSSSGRSISFLRGFSSLGDSSDSAINIAIIVPQEAWDPDLNGVEDPFTLKIELFDGEVADTWDALNFGIIADEIRYKLFADDEANQSTDPADLVLEDDATGLVDNGWSGLFERIVAQDRKPGMPGDAFNEERNSYVYHLVAEWIDPVVEDEQNNFRVRVNSPAQPFLPRGSTVGFVGHTPLDPFEFFFPVSTYDGTFSFKPLLPVDGLVELDDCRIDIYDGDFDVATDLFDANTPDRALLPFPTSNVGNLMGSKANPGNPADDAADPNIAVAPQAVYDVITPFGAPDDTTRGSGYTVETVDGQERYIVTNPNPSGDKEWELFRIVSDSDDCRAAYDNGTFEDFRTSADAIVPVLREGEYNINIRGLDGRNTVFLNSSLDILPLRQERIIGDTVWNDADADQNQSVAELGLPGVLVDLVTSNSEVIEQKLTDSNGEYTFQVPPAEHTVRVNPSNFSLTVSTGRIGDLVFFDVNGNGVNDSGEPGIPGVRLRLFDTTDNGGVFSPFNSNVRLIGDTTTDVDGNYNFLNVAEGIYTVALEVSTLPPGVEITSGQLFLLTNAINIADGGVFDGADYGFSYDANLSAIGDLVWLDNNGNGVREPEEAGINGVKLDLLDAGSNVVDSTVTNAGVYLFSELPSGQTFTVQIDPTSAGLQGLNATTIPTTTVSTTGGVVELGVDFGYQNPSPRTISNRLFLDSDHNGLQDAGEPGISGATAILTENGYRIAATTTNVDGDFTFEGLTEGTYAISVMDNVNVQVLTGLVATTDESLNGMEIDLTGINTSATGVNFGYDDAGQFANYRPTTSDSITQMVADEDVLTFDFGLALVQVDIETTTNGEDADNPTGPELLDDSSAVILYTVTNTSEQVTLTDLVVTDPITGINCPIATLAAGATDTSCTIDVTVTTGQYSNTGTVVAQPVNSIGDPLGGTVTDSDPSNHLGIGKGSIDLEVLTNTQDADIPTGPVVLVGETATIAYVVTNNGDVTLTNIIVTDPTTGLAGCTFATLASGASETCTTPVTVTAGQYMNEGTATGQPVNSAGTPIGGLVDDVDPSHHLGGEGSVDIEVSTNGDDADTPPGPFVLLNDSVQIVYTVTNNGTLDLVNLVVNDVATGLIDCPIARLNVGESDQLSCVVNRTATTLGQFANLGDVSAQPIILGELGEMPAGPRVTDEDPSHHFVAVPNVDIEVATNGVDADLPTDAPRLLVDETANVVYVVTNTGNVDLNNVTVADTLTPAFTCDLGSVAAGQIATVNCEQSIPVTPGLYANGGEVTGQPVDASGTPVGNPVSDIDPTHHFGIAPPVAVPNEDLGNLPGTVGDLGDITANDSDPIDNGTIDSTTVDLDPTTPAEDKTLVVAGEGTWEDDGNGNVTFTPEAGFTGNPTPIPYTVKDNDGLLSNEALLTVTYLGPPIATPNESLRNLPGEVASLGDITADDTDPDGTIDSTTVDLDPSTPGEDKVLVVPGEGTWNDDGNGNVTFTPLASFTGNPTPIPYTVKDNDGLLSNEALLTVTYLIPPVATPNESLDNATGTVASLGDITADDTDADGTIDSTSVDLDPSTPGEDKVLVVAGEGTWADDGNGNVTFTPEAGFVGNPTPILYTVKDNDGLLSNEALLTVTYQRVPPIATPNNSLRNLPGSVASLGDITADDTDADGTIDSTTVDLDPSTPGEDKELFVPGEGTWADDGNGNVTFTPLASFTGNPTPIPYTVKDNDGLLSNEALLTVTYLVPPVATPNESLNNAQGTVASLGDITADDNDPDGTIDSTTVDLDPSTPGEDDVLVVPGEGTWNNDGNGNVTFTPQSGFTGNPTPIPYTVKDNDGLLSNEALLTVTYLVPQNPSIDIRKEIEGPDTRTFPDGTTEVTFEISVTNDGDVDLTNVEVSDPLAPACDNTIGSLAVGQTVTYSCTVTLPGGGSGETKTWLDNFNPRSYTHGSDGSESWSGPWIEYDVADSNSQGATSGNVLVGSNTKLWLDDYPNTGTKPSARRTADLSGATSATLMFDWETHDGVDRSDEAQVQISSDGGATYTTLKTFTGFSGWNGGAESFDISNYISGLTTVRFRINKYYGGRYETFKVDNVKITAEYGGDPQGFTNEACVSGDGAGQTVDDCDTSTVEIDKKICIPDVDFEGFHRGQVITTQIPGMMVSASGGSGQAMIFDSSNPTGGDRDLGTPNEDFGGPGRGSGGGAGQSGENAVALGKLLIISEDGDSNDPDDNWSGGTLTFTFDSPTELTSVDIVDIDDYSGGYVTAYGSGGNVLATAPLVNLGNNSVQTVAIAAIGVGRLEVYFTGSGAISGLNFCPPTTDPGICLVVIDEDGVDNGTSTIEQAANSNGVTPEWLVNDDRPTENGNPVFRWNQSFPGDVVLLPTGQTHDEGWFAMPNNPVGKNGAFSLQAFYDGTVSQSSLDEVRDVKPLRNADLAKLVGRSCVAIVYDSDINVNYGPLQGNLQGERYGKFSFTVLEAVAPGSIPESQSSSSLIDLRVRVESPLEFTENFNP